MINENKNESSRSHQYKMFLKIQEFLTTAKCRRALLLSHFEEDESASKDSFKKNCCDNCSERLKTDKQVDQQVDVSKDALRVFKKFISDGETRA